MVTTFKKIFSLDIRSLAAFRIGISIILFWNIYLQAANIVAFYTDAGVYPRSLLITSLNSIAIHAVSGALWFQVGMLVISGLISVALLLGYKTRIATILAWFFLVSIQNRDPMVLQYGDDLLRVLLFWSMFLPLGAYYSIDSFKKNAGRKTYHICSAGSIAFIVQIFILYFFGAILKSGIQWHQEGSAVYYAVRLEQNATFFTPFLLHAPKIALLFLTHAVWLTEFVMPFLFFFPVFTGQFRTLAIAIFISLHLGLGIFMNLGTFMWIPIVGLVGMLPEEFWHTLGNFFRKYRPQRLTIYYDDDCGFCEHAVYFLQAVLFLYDVKIVPAQTEESIYKKMQAHTSWVITDTKQRVFFKADGFAKILSVSPVFFFLAPILRWQPLHVFANVVYTYTAEHRTLFCSIRRPEKKQRIPITAVVMQSSILLLLLCVVWWNVSTLPQVNLSTIDKRVVIPVFGIVELLHLDQSWGMFAQIPPIDDGWYVVPGRLENGTIVDLFTRKPFTWEKPVSIAALYQDQQWYAYLYKLSYRENSHYWPYFVSYLCQRWNDNHTGATRVVSAQLYFMRKQLPKPFATTNTPVKKDFFLSQQCR